MSGWRVIYQCVGAATLSAALAHALAGSLVTSALLMIATAGFAVASEVARLGP